MNCLVSARKLIKVRYNGSHFFSRPGLPPKVIRGCNKINPIFDGFYEEALEEKIIKFGVQKTAQWIYEKYKKVDDVSIDYETVESLVQAKRLSVLNKVKLFRDKAFWNEFNYFVTFTNGLYEDEEVFREKVKNLLRNMKYRFDWRAIGVFERGGENNRLHFHGLFRIPEGTMPGPLHKRKSFSLKHYKSMSRYENDWFLERLGRNDFQKISIFEKNNGNVISYMTKYVFKSQQVDTFYNRGVPSSGEIDPEKIDCIQLTVELYGATHILFEDLFSTNDIVFRLRC